MFAVLMNQPWQSGEFNNQHSCCECSWLSQSAAAAGVEHCPNVPPPGIILATTTEIKSHKPCS